ncbi:MAG: hypothetical protein AAGF01_17225 [Cyanobacteria bacterium P01_G01_bin.38]
MRFGLICFLALFFGTELVQWVAHLPWLSEFELSLPLTLLGGGGLAIASNYKHLNGLLPLPQAGQPDTAIAPNPAASNPTTSNSAAPSTHPALSPPPPSQTSASSISFKINKPHHP